MIYLKSIQIANFKGIEQLACDFEDFTLLAGLNNSGKTSILQAVYLIISALDSLTSVRDIFSQTPNRRTFEHRKALAYLGFEDPVWIRSYLNAETSMSIAGEFANGLIVRLTHSSNFNFELEVSYQSADILIENPFHTPNAATEEQEAFRERVKNLIGEVSNISAEFLIPPGNIPSREDMLNYSEYENQLRQGKGTQLWRNNIWWGIQREGFETFEPARKLVSRYFSGVELFLPTLGMTGPSNIQIKYKEGSREPLDVALSGTGLRTFISLAQVLEQSTASIILIDEPDAHLHASQQAIVLELLMDAVLNNDRQAIIATHSPKMITWSPGECLRWVERGQKEVTTNNDMYDLLERLGVTDEVYLARGTFPDIIIYVEGDSDKPILEALIKWCRDKCTNDEPLPSTLVARHKDGRFDAEALQGIVRVMREMGYSSQVIGIRDLDWYYCERPGNEPEIRTGKNWKLVTLQCKEMENLFCDPELLWRIFDDKIPQHKVEQIVFEESKAEDLVKTWKYNVRSRIRERLPNELDSSTKERQADEIFEEWTNNERLRCQLVAGKMLLKRVRERIKQEYNLTYYPFRRSFEGLDTVSSNFMAIAKAIFPNFT